MTGNTTAWHAEPALLSAYVEGRLDAVVGASLERHLDSCATCRTAIRPLVDPTLLTEAWSGIREVAESPTLPVAVRLARRVGLPESTGVLLAATASLRSSWLSGAFVALGFAVVATALGGGSMLWPFLLVAPLIPVLGVAAVYGPADDPFETLAVSTPYGRTRLIVLRSVAVLVTSVPGACLLGLVLPGPTWVAAAWLGPALAMLSLLLAVASFVGPRIASAVVALLWCGVVLASVRGLNPTWPVQQEQQVVYVALAATGAVVLLVRSQRTRRIGAAL